MATKPPTSFSMMCLLVWKITSIHLFCSFCVNWQQKYARCIIVPSNMEHVETMRTQNRQWISLRMSPAERMDLNCKHCVFILNTTSKTPLWENTCSKHVFVGPIPIFRQIHNVRSHSFRHVCHDEPIMLIQLHRMTKLSKTKFVASSIIYMYIYIYIIIKSHCMILLISILFYMYVYVYIYTLYLYHHP